MSAKEQSLEYAHELNSAFTMAGLNDAVRFSRGESNPDPQQVALSINPLSIRPETYSGVCTAVGQFLSCMGLASNEQAPPEYDENDLVIT
jgi:hypothetical protein